MEEKEQPVQVLEEENLINQNKIKEEPADTGNLDEVKEELISIENNNEQNVVSGRIKHLNTCLSVISNTKPIIYDKCIKTGDLSMQLFSLLGLESTEELIISSYIANAGYLAVPENILYKSGFLNDKEYGVIKMHPEISVNLAKRIYTADLNEGESLSDEFYDRYDKMMLIIHDHHELPMGKGYYSKINRVPRESFIIGVADRFIGATHQFGSIYKIVLDNENAAKKAMSFFDETSPVFSIIEQNNIYEFLINYV